MWVRKACKTPNAREIVKPEPTTKTKRSQARKAEPKPKAEVKPKVTPETERERVETVDAIVPPGLALGEDNSDEEGQDNESAI